MPKLYPNLTYSYPCSLYTKGARRAHYGLTKSRVIRASLESGSCWTAQGLQVRGKDPISAYRNGSTFKVDGRVCRNAEHALKVMESIARLDEWFES